MRESMIFYRSFYESLEGMTETTKAQVYDAIFIYGLDFKEPVFTDAMAKSLFTLIKPQIDANVKKYHNGKKPKLKQVESKTEAKPKQETSKSEANVNDNVNVNVNVNNNIPNWVEFLAYAQSKKPNVDKDELLLKYESWVENDWCTNSKGKQHKIKNWRSTLLNTLPYINVKILSEDEIRYNHVMNNL